MGSLDARMPGTDHYHIITSQFIHTFFPLSFTHTKRLKYFLFGRVAGILAGQIAQGLQKEAELIRAKLPKGCFFCVLTPEGKLLSSEQLADTLRQAKSGGRSSACFLIGSSFGIAPELKKLADLQLSMSKMTFPHHLARVMALEQLYRAEAIQAGSKYHK